MLVGCLGGCFVCLGGSFAYLASFRKRAPKVTESEITAMGHKFVRLPDGRLLEYTISGDQNGVPVFWQHGYMNSCLSNPCWDRICEKLNVKLIAVSMPGFGLSDVYPDFKKRQLGDWPSDVLVVLKNEQINRVHFVGTSAGCVHVAALAHGFPPKMVGNICFVVPTCPDDVPGSNEGKSKILLCFQAMMKKPYIGDFVAFKIGNMDAFERTAIAPDAKAALVKGKQMYPEVFDGFIKTMAHSTSFTWRGFCDNTDTVFKPLPFELSTLGHLIVSERIAIAVTTSPDDTTNPPVMQRWFKDQIPGAIMMHFEPGWGHLHFCPPDNFERVMRFCISGSDPAQV